MTRMPHWNYLKDQDDSRNIFIAKSYVARQGILIFQSDLLLTVLGSPDNDFNVTNVTVSIDDNPKSPTNPIT